MPTTHPTKTKDPACFQVSIQTHKQDLSGLNTQQINACPPFIWQQVFRITKP